MGKILTCILPFLIFLLNLCLPLKTDTTSPNLGKASPTAWSLINSGREIVTKIGYLPFLREPICLRKLRQISESPKQYGISVPWSFSFAIFNPKTKVDFEGETLYRSEHLSLRLFQTLEHGKYPILEPFFGLLIAYYVSKQ